MKTYRLFSIISGILIVSVILAGCATLPAAAPLSSTPAGVQSMPTEANPQTAPTSGDSGQGQSPTPIVGTAVEGGSQSEPLPTDTIPAVLDGGKTVTLADNGTTLTLQTGDRFVLMLGDGYQWDFNNTDPAVASLVMGLMPIRGSQGVYEAHQAGQTILSASGDPLCRSAKPPCMMPSVAFQITIVVK